MLGVVTLRLQLQLCVSVLYLVECFQVISPCITDKEGRLFIDRNGDVFAVLLEFMRIERIMPFACVTEDQIRAEFDYFGFDYIKSEEEQHREPQGNRINLTKTLLEEQYDTSILPVWILNVLIPFVNANKKAPFYTEKNGLGKFFFNLRGKLGNYIVDSDSFYRIQESKEGYLAFNAHNIDVSRYVMDIIRDFLLKSEEGKELFRQSILKLGEFSHVSFKLYTEQINSVDTHSICITAFK